MEEDFEVISCQIIVAAGTAKSCYVEAIQAAKKMDFNKAQSLMEKGANTYVECHRAHAELLTLSADSPIDMTLLLVHAEDQMMSCETVQITAKEMIDLYRLVHSLGGGENKTAGI